MCDPITIGLVAAGTAFSMYGQSRVASAQKKDVAKFGASYEAERARQKGFQGENAATVADTLKTYSPDAVAQRTADATANRQKIYTAPIMAKDYVQQSTADSGGNSVVDARNRATGLTQKLKDLSLATVKGALDAHGDASLGGNLAAANNANKIGMVSRIAKGSEQAEAVNQGVLPTALSADQNAGATWSGIGDTLKLAGTLYGMYNPSSSLSDSLFGAKVPVVGPNLPAGTPATYGRSIFGVQF